MKTAEGLNSTPRAKRLAQIEQEAVIGRARLDDAADFIEAYVRRALEPRLRGHGRIHVRKTRALGFTVVHQYTSEWNGREVALPVAQLRSKGRQLQLFWKRANGRWVPYESSEGRAFIGTLEACLREVDEDRWGCFWG